ncbi:hypothetical protein ACTFIY_007919 [Dictyostelium cf. discoideum]
MSGAALNSKTWGKSLIYHRKMMNAEYKNGMKRLSFLAEERHVQYREEYIQNVRDRIAKNKEHMDQQNKIIKDLNSRSNNRKNLISMGWESLKTQMAQEKKQRKENSKLIFEKTKLLQDRARREWLIEMNDKCTTWNKSPNELKYAKYRLLNKKVLERIPRSGNYVLDLNEQPNNNQIYESTDDYSGPLRSNTQRLAHILSKTGVSDFDSILMKNNKNNVDNNNNNNINNMDNLEVNPSSPDYPEYLEFLKFNKQLEENRQKHILESNQGKSSAFHESLNSENVLKNYTSGIDYDHITDEILTFTDLSEDTDSHDFYKEIEEEINEEESRLRQEAKLNEQEAIEEDAVEEEYSVEEEEEQEGEEEDAVEEEEEDAVEEETEEDDDYSEETEDRKN